MGIPATDFEYGGFAGYGDGRGLTGNRNYAPEIISQASKPLPFATNG